MPRHVPRRSCIVCGLSSGKDGLLRVVRRPDQKLELDFGGRRPGRGAYVCGSAKCWEAAIDRGGFARALGVRIDQGTLDRLRADFRDIADQVGVSE